MPTKFLATLCHRFFRREASEYDLHAELQSHLALDVQQRVERGASPEAARQAALRELGNIGLITEVVRDGWGWTWLEALLRDARYAVRMVRKSPGMSLVVILMLALGIGSTTAIFTFVNGILLRPLPFPEPNQLVMLWEVPPHTKKPNVVALGNFVSWKQRSHSFQSLAAFLGAPMNLVTPQQSEQVPGLKVTSDFFATLGTPPLLGRTFRSGEYFREKPLEVVLSYRAWQTRFGGRSDVIGKKISIDMRHHEIIGVMPPGFGFPNVEADLYTPLAINGEQGRNFSIIGRLRPRVSIGAAKAEVASIAAHTAGENLSMNAGWSATVVPLLEQTVGNIRPILLLLFLAVGLLLLIACSNVGNLLLMRSGARARELGVRLALGASKARVARQLLVESLLLASLGGLSGIALSAISVEVIRNKLPESLQIPRLNEITLQVPVLAFSVCVTVLSCILFGLAPALQALKHDLIRDLRAATRSTISGGKLRNMLVIAEVALAVILVLAAGLMVRSFVRLSGVESGFHIDHVLTLQMLLLPVRNEQFRAESVDNMLTRIRTLPGVLSAGSIGILPMQGTNSGTWYYRVDHPEPAPSNRPEGDISIITPGYFRTLGIPLLRGRDFDNHDRKGSKQVAILNQTAAHMLFPGEDPIGKQVKVWWADPSPIVEIVGVARDIRHSQLNSPPDPCLFMPNDQQPFPFTSLVVRTVSNPLALASAIRQQIRQIDADQGVAKVATLTQMVAGSIARPRVEAFLLAIFGSTALALACIGLYGVVAYSVAQRFREIGLRMALGASAPSVFRTILADGFRLTLMGLLSGLASGFLLARYVRSLLFEIEPNDPMTLCAVTSIILVVSLIACCWPAYRATTVDPASMLREE